MGLLSIVPVVDNPDYLTTVANHQNQVLLGATFQFFLVPIYIGFALLLYPLLKRYGPSLALGFVEFRMVAGVFQLIGMMLLSLFILVSQKYTVATQTDALFLETIGEMLQSFRDLTNHMGVMLATALGNFLLYYLLYKGKYIPNWLSLWGILGNLLLILGSFLLFFQLINVISKAYAIITLPLVVQEAVLAIWLIRKGLNSEPIKDKS